MNNLQNFRTQSKDKMHLLLALSAIEDLSSLVKQRIVEAKSGEDYKSLCLDILESLAIVPTIIDTAEGVLNQTDVLIEKMIEAHNKEIIGITKNITDSAKSLNIPSMEQVRKMYATVSEEELNKFAASFVTHLNLLDANNPNNMRGIVGKSDIKERDLFESKVTIFCQSVPNWQNFSNSQRAAIRSVASEIVATHNVTSVTELEQKTSLGNIQFLKNLWGKK